MHTDHLSKVPHIHRTIRPASTKALNNIFSLLRQFHFSKVSWKRPVYSAKFNWPAQQKYTSTFLKFYNLFVFMYQGAKSTPPLLILLNSTPSQCCWWFVKPYTSGRHCWKYLRTSLLLLCVLNSTRIRLFLKFLWFYNLLRTLLSFSRHFTHTATPSTQLKCLRFPVVQAASGWNGIYDFKP